MWQGTGSTNTWNPSCGNPRVLVVLLQFSWILAAGGLDSVVTLNTMVGKSRKKVANRVARSPARFCDNDAKLCCCHRLLCDLCCSYRLVGRSSDKFLSFVSLRPCSSSASTCSFCVVRIVFHLIIPFVLDFS